MNRKDFKTKIPQEKVWSYLKQDYGDSESWKNNSWDQLRKDKETRSGNPKF